MPLPAGEDTIVAIATGGGRAAIALVRLSGPAAHAIAARCLHPWPIATRVATLCTVRDPASGDELDRSLVLAYEAPHSYTGEDAVELMTHGGALVPATVGAALIAAGARQATAGEFTRRAVANGKMDLLQAEAIGDLVDARSRAGQSVALAQLDGGLSRRIGELRDGLLQLEALLAYDIDFPEEDDGPIPRQRIVSHAGRMIESLEALLATAPAGELIRDGALVVLAGAPNVGKSSLFNALLGRSRAIVTEIPGTTRDALEAVIDGGALPLRLVDTAGLRASSDVVERLGIEVSERYLSEADVILACGDDARTLDEALTRVAALSRAPVLAVRTKSDLGDGDSDRLPDAIAVSAERGTGLPALVARITDLVAAARALPEPGAPILTRARHRTALTTAAGELREFLRVWEDGLPATVAAVHLRTAVAALEELIGAVDVEDVLDRVFRDFCVGK